MRESIGSTLLFSLIITIIIVMIGFLVGSLSYSKAFKVKNRIIDIIEKNDGWNSAAEEEIKNKLSSTGYRLNADRKCPAGYEKKTDYDICIATKSTDRGTYYKVETYMHFDIPLIGEMLEFPVNGETKVLQNLYINYEVE